MQNRIEYHNHIYWEDKSQKDMAESLCGNLETASSSKHDFEFSHTQMENGFSFILIKKSAAVNRNLLCVSFEGKVTFS